MKAGIIILSLISLSTAESAEEDPYGKEIQQAKNFDFRRVGKEIEAGDQLDQINRVDSDDLVISDAYASSSQVSEVVSRPTINHKKLSLKVEDDLIPPASLAARQAIVHEEEEEGEDEDTLRDLREVAHILTAAVDGSEGQEQKDLERKLWNLERTNPFLSERLKDLVATAVPELFDDDDDTEGKRDEQVGQRRTGVIVDGEGNRLKNADNSGWIPVLPGTKNYLERQRGSAGKAVLEEKKDDGLSGRQFKLVIRVEERDSYKPDFTDALPAGGKGERDEDVGNLPLYQDNPLEQGLYGQRQYVRKESVPPAPSPPYPSQRPPTSAAQTPSNYAPLPPSPTTSTVFEPPGQTTVYEARSPPPHLKTTPYANLQPTYANPQPTYVNHSPHPNPPPIPPPPKPTSPHIITPPQTSFIALPEPSNYKHEPFAETFPPSPSPINDLSNYIGNDEEYTPSVVTYVRTGEEPTAQDLQLNTLFFEDIEKLKEYGVDLALANDQHGIVDYVPGKSIVVPEQELLELDIVAASPPPPPLPPRTPAMPHIESDDFPNVVRHLSASTRSLPFLPQDMPEMVFDGPGRAPARGADVVADFGAHTGGSGAFGWYSDHPVHIKTDRK